MSDLLEMAKTGVESVRDKFDSPTDDWEPLALIRDAKGVIHPALFQLPEDAEMASALARRLTELCWDLDAHEAVMVSSIWVLDGLSDEEIEQTRRGDRARPREHLDRKEAVLIIRVTKESEDVIRADIIRSEDKPPKLGPWREFGTTTGTFGDAIKMGVRIREPK